jgi:hypothetical protein
MALQHIKRTQGASKRFLPIRAYIYTGTTLRFMCPECSVTHVGSRDRAVLNVMKCPWCSKETETYRWTAAIENT